VHVGKLSEVKATCIRALVGLLAAGALLGACTPHVHKPGPAAPGTVGPSRAARAYRIDPSASLLTLLVYRAGPLAALGHNHVIASHEVQGRILLDPDLHRSGCEIAIAVASLRVDEPELRANAGPDFVANVPPAAREGTQRNMLGGSLLDAEHHPSIEATCASLDLHPGGSPQSGGLDANVQVALKGGSYSVRVPLTYVLHDHALQVDGATTVRQSDLGLTPFSLMLGALRVQDEVTVRVHLVARP
jgi:polyisoprenoid-binding protein YceI